MLTEKQSEGKCEGRINMGTSGKKDDNKEPSHKRERRKTNQSRMQGPSTFGRDLVGSWCSLRHYSRVVWRFRESPDGGSLLCTV